MDAVLSAAERTRLFDIVGGLKRRGLLIVDATVASSGSIDVPDGKIVWAALPVAGP